jgi:hypothetical protein
MTPEEREERMDEKKAKGYRNKVDHNELYLQIKEHADNFNTPERMAESDHLLDTQKNESLNRKVMQFAPKEVQYSTTKSLHGRVACVVGLDSLGNAPYYKRLCAICGITAETAAADALFSFLEAKDKKLANDYARKQEPATKNRRRATKNESMKRQRTDNATAAHNRMTYSSGMAVGPRKPKAAASAKLIDERVCLHCGLNGHVQTRSQHCLKNTKAVKKSVAKLLDDMVAQFPL